MKLILAIVVAAVLLFGCAGQQGGAPEKQLKVTGSDTMVILGQAWAEKYMSLYPQKKVSITGGGSGVGIAAIIDGTTDIAQASRDMKESEIEKAKAKGANPVKTIVAYDGIAIIVHPDNPVSELTSEQVGKIFKGEITNWKDVGGPDEKIGIYSRESSSGTYEFMKEHVLKNADYAKDSKYSAGTALLVQSVSQDKTAIGYVGVAYTKDRSDVKILKIAKAVDETYFLPSKETVKSGDYPIARSLNFYTNGEPAGDAKEFIGFILGEEGQKVVEETGYFRV